MATVESEFLLRTEAAKMLRVSVETVDKRLAELGAVRFGTRILIPRAGVQRFLDANRVQRPAD